MRALYALVAIGLLLSACTADETEVLDGSAGNGDAGAVDAAIDAGRDAGGDAGRLDSGMVDSGTLDAATDGGAIDAGRDAGIADGAADGGADAGVDGGGGDAGQDDGGACAQKEDCQPGGWCRETQNGGMACEPWAAEGETCGGFTAPWAVSRCDVDSVASCNNFVFIPDAPGVCSIAATVADLIATPATYDGHVVALQNVYPVASAPSCTPAMPCNTANACSATLSVGDTVGASSVVALLDVPALTPTTCAGNECDYLDQCPQPVDMLAIVVGRFHAATFSIEAQYFNPGL